MGDEGVVAVSLRRAREAIVREHTASENRHDFEATVATFAEPRYEVVATGEVHASAEEVRRFLGETGAAFPDFRLITHAIHHAERVVAAETEFVGTHRGMFRGLPPTGRRVHYRMCNLFVFEEDRLVCERLHFDALTILKALGVASDPTSLRGRVETAIAHPVLVVRAYAGALFGRGAR